MEDAMNAHSVLMLVFGLPTLPADNGLEKAKAKVLAAFQAE